MKSHRIIDRLRVAGVLCALLAGWQMFGSSCLAQAQDTPAPAAVRGETRLVRVDVIVTDKKGNYIHDLSANDFKGYDDNKQQQVANFSFGADPNRPQRASRYSIVLRRRQHGLERSASRCAAAVKFIDANVALIERWPWWSLRALCASLKISRLTRPS
jgi:hypothetical protein